MIVIDSSTFSKFLMKEENWEKIVPYLDISLEAYAVDMLIIETTNVMWKYMRKYKLITEEQAFGLYEQMIKLVKEKVIILEDSEKFLQDALKIAMGYNIPIYDSLFLAQAKALKASLITSDRRQSVVAKEMGLESTYIE